MGRKAEVGGPQGHSSLMGMPIFLDSGALACTAQAKSEDDANTLVVNPVKGADKKELMGPEGQRWWGHKPELVNVHDVQERRSA